MAKVSIETLRKPDLDYSGGRNIHTQLFICGLHRSGTTLIEQYLTSRYQLAYLRANVPENEGQFLQNIYPIAKAYGGPGRFAFAPEMNPKPPSVDQVLALQHRLLGSWAPFVVGTETLLCEKSPPNLTKINWLRAVFPRAKFLVVVRDPRAVAAATQKWSGERIPQLIKHWDIAHTIVLEALQADCYVLKYEDFCNNPEHAIENCGLGPQLEKRATMVALDARFGTLNNSNASYIQSGQVWGGGSWQSFGYEI